MPPNDCRCISPHRNCWHFTLVCYYLQFSDLTKRIIAWKTWVTAWSGLWSTVVSVVCAATVVAIGVWGSWWVRQVVLVALRHAATFNSSDAAGRGPRAGAGEPSWSTPNNVARCCGSCCCLCWMWWVWTLCSPMTRCVWCCSFICMCAACSCCWRSASCSIWKKTQHAYQTYWNRCRYEQKRFSN